MKYTFIHLSDLHYIEDKQEAYDLICDRLNKDLALSNLENPHVIFSGDFVYSGASQQAFDALKSKLNEYLIGLGIPPSKRYSTPGNHDISQEIIKKIAIMQRGILSEMNEEYIFNDSLAEIRTQLNFEKKFEHYLNFNKNFTTNNLSQETITGQGWSLSPDLAIYSLNTALCSFGGIKDRQGDTISDFGRLMIDTRSIHKWLLNDTSKIRILVMHHPIDWLAPWAKVELEKIINESFKLAYFGHIHEGQSAQHIKDGGNCICLTAPALFTKKSDQLGYSITRLDTITGKVEIEYRQFARNNQFVLGTLLAGNDIGKRTYDTLPKERHTCPTQGADHVDSSTLSILRQEFDKSIKCYSNKAGFWIERDLSKTPESEFKVTTPPELTSIQLASSPISCIIRAPSEFGLSSLGYHMALRNFEHSNGKSILLRLDCEEHLRGPKEIANAVEKRCALLKIDADLIHGFILDNWTTDKAGKKTLAQLKEAYPTAIIIALCGVDDCAQVSDYIEKSEKDPTEGLGIIYLWALDRSKVRLLVEQYTINANHLDSDRVTKKIISDLDSLNTHRSPLNCLLLLRLYEQAFDESPVNRTEMISRVLNLLFFQFDAIPSYASRPDLKDCEFVLGCFCEKLIRENRKAFTKQEFNKLDTNCQENHIDLEIHILFAFLHAENIIMQKGSEFEFRFNYWLYYFAAHRMHHDPSFREFMLSQKYWNFMPA